MLCGNLTRTFLESAVVEHVGAGDIVALCAEPGMGKTQLACAVAERLHADAVEFISLTGFDSETASVRLSKTARRLAPRLRKGKRLCVIIDDICPADEYGVSCMARPILRLHKLGALVVLTLRPEAEQVLDALDGCLRIAKDDLRMRRSDIAPRERSEAIMRASDGIPALVDALQTHSVHDGTPDTFLPAFGETLCSLAGTMIRDSLLDEDRRIRFAAMLFGRGSYDDLSAAVGELHVDATMAALQESALVSLDPASKAFRCVGLEDDIGIMFCSDVLAAAGRAWPACTAAAVDRLVEQGRAERAARIVALLDEQQRATLALRNGIEFLNVGETELVRSALAIEVFSEEVSPYAYEMLDSAYQALWAPDRKEDVLLGTRAFATARDERDHVRVRLLCLGRTLLGGSSHGEGAIALEHDDPMAAGLALHLEAVSLLIHGRMGECRRLLRMYRPDGIERTLSEALLAVDEELARVLLCEQDAPSRERVRASEEFFERMGLSPLTEWGSIIGAVRATMLGVAAPNGLEAALAVAERRGDAVLAAALCCALVLSDLVKRAFVSAHVQARHAKQLADTCRSGVLADIAALLYAISAAYLEEPAAHKPLLRRSWASGQVESIARAVCSALSEEPSGVDASVPHDYLWLVMALANLPGTFSRRFRARIHPAWYKQLRGIEHVVREFQEAPGEPAVLELEAPERPALERGIEIRLFGGFSLCVNGIEIPGRELSARNAATVLALLAAAPGHSMTRINLIESAWPGSDYIGGRERIYQAVSRIRRIVSRIDDSLEPIALARNDGAIAFNEGQVRCDIDDFVEAARAALRMEGQHDGEVVDAVQRAEEIYRGSLHIPLQDGGGLMRSRAREMAKLYADVLVLGSETALRLEKRKLAVHFAESATLIDGKREDAFCALIRALKASGRFEEAVRRYRAYLKKGSHGRRRRPSPELQAAMGALLAEQDRADAVEGAEIDKEA